MPFQIPVGYKFALVALDNAGIERNMPSEIHLGDETWAVFGAPVDFANYWREWLGSLQVEQLQRATLSIIAIAPSKSPGILDIENQQLRNKVVALFYSLLMVEVFHQDGGLIVSGANVDGTISIREVSRLDSHYRPPGVRDLKVNPGWLKDAFAISQGILDTNILNGSFERLKRGFQAWIRGTQEYNGEERVHQFVRATEAPLKPAIGKSKKQFAHRGMLFAGDSARPRLEELYDLRGASEHMNPFQNVLTAYSETDREMIGLQRSFQAQALASQVYRRIFACADLRAEFATDDSIDQFWAMSDADQRVRWGPPLDLDELAKRRFRANDF